ncbi:ester cyclase [Streptomyces sp. SCSIO 30461]|uniref:ester cyclase n=1 Tax=Streptomyces sp. SCSIO 30461 TaxID=3118085 RepID=UPI0030D137A9
MTFVQMIECKTERLDELNRLLDTWVEQTGGKRTATHSLVAKDRSDSAHVIELVEFPSYEDAMRNSNLPETERNFQKMVELCDGMPTFTDLDVVRDEQLNKGASRRFFLDCIAGNPELLRELLTHDYRNHDPSNPADLVGIDAFLREVARWSAGFDFTIELEDQIAEGDRVTTRWTWNGRHNGEFMGVEPTGRQCTMTGTTTHRFREGMICESWWQYDRLGLMGQLGVLEM